MMDNEQWLEIRDRLTKLEGLPEDIHRLEKMVSSAIDEGSKHRAELERRLTTLEAERNMARWLIGLAAGGGTIALLLHFISVPGIGG